MDTAKLLTELTRKVDRMNTILSNMQKEKMKEVPTETWVKVSTIRELTVWDNKRKLEKARREGLLIQRKGGNGIEYLLESINSLFIKQKQAS